VPPATTAGTISGVGITRHEGVRSSAATTTAVDSTSATLCRAGDGKSAFQRIFHHIDRPRCRHAHDEYCTESDEFGSANQTRGEFRCTHVGGDTVDHDSDSQITIQSHSYGTTQMTQLALFLSNPAAFFARTQRCHIVSILFNSRRLFLFFPPSLRYARPSLSSVLLALSAPPALPQRPSQMTPLLGQAHPHRCPLIHPCTSPLRIHPSFVARDVGLGVSNRLLSRSALSCPSRVSAFLEFFIHH
jgi:hypothetical protein